MAEWKVGDPLPPVGTVMYCGHPYDRIRIQREAHGWSVAHNRSPYRPCTFETVVFWAPLELETLADTREGGGPRAAETRPCWLR
jgi:hypothetical protein